MEILDLYDVNENSLNKLFYRGESELLPGEYYLLVQCWVVNKNNEILLTRRSFNKKSYPGKWEPTIGHVVSKEPLEDAIIRELKEEINLDVKKEELIFLTKFIRLNAAHQHVWYIKRDITINDIEIDHDEVIDAKFVTVDEFKKMFDNNEIVDVLKYMYDFFDVITK